VLSPQNCRRFDRLTIVDAVEFVHDDLLPRLRPVPLGGTTVVHPVCSIVKMNLTGKLEAIAAGCSERATLPLAAGCCGFAGDRGFLVPELTRAALQGEAAEVRSINGERHVSSSRTCEVGLTRATGRVYRSFLHLVDEATSQDVLSD
jgi:D-lactate dehydrogenase